MFGVLEKGEEETQQTARKTNVCETELESHAYRLQRKGEGIKEINYWLWYWRGEGGGGRAVTEEVQIYYIL